MLIYIILSVCLSLSGMVVFASKRKHLLIMLLSLEFIMISLYFNILIYLSQLSYEFFFSMIFFNNKSMWSSFSVICISFNNRTHGNDYIMTFSSLW
uniref:NADH dehydrogenase subunit 4L n=1 Tax=Anoplophora chinensis TaxID=217632 RepID=A0A0U2XQN5_ANOCN|nr:NADH dehydrogenase subunit 4L [Anoplophora chinensis]ALS54026.1 NADH dehydrogenase subunit 4L [Anoplophora chinensis]UNB14375.1 NADH dehydrogenase subunit 4L [Anoplophora chinensis]